MNARPQNGVEPISNGESIGITTNLSTTGFRTLISIVRCLSQTHMSIGVSKTKIGLLGTIYMAGWASSAIVIPRMSDIYGRKRVYSISMIG